LRAFINALEAFHAEPAVQIIILGVEAKRADPLTFPAAVA